LCTFGCGPRIGPEQSDQSHSHQKDRRCGSGNVPEPAGSAGGAGLSLGSIFLSVDAILKQLLRMRPLLDGFRGGRRTDLDVLWDVIATFSVLAADLAGEVAEIDVNPLLCGEAITAVDGLVVPRA
jgi:hypothetical protein